MSAHAVLANKIAGFEAVQSLVFKNTNYDTEADQYAVRPWQKDEDDQYPCIVIAMPDLEFEDDLCGVARFGKAQVEIRCLSYKGSEAWALAKAVAYNGGSATDKTNRSGMHRHIDEPNGLLSSRWVRVLEDEIEDNTNADRKVILVECIYDMEFDGGVI